MKGNFFAGSVADGFLHDARRRRNDVTLRASNFTKIDWTMEILQSSAPIQYSISLTVRRRPLFLRDVMAAKQISIFVLDVAKRESFAFEAEHASAAEDLIRSPWFVTALDAAQRSRLFAICGRFFHARRRQRKRRFSWNAPANSRKPLIVSLSRA
jgi:hypothetical protein